MSMRFSFNHDAKDNKLKMIVDKPPAPVTKLPDLQAVKAEPRTEIISETKSGNKKVDEIICELNSLVGLNTVKKLILEIRAYVEIQKKRKAENLLSEPMSLHMIFKGNPGSGKTTVARIVGSLFKEMGILEKGHLIEVERADLVGEYIGHTAHKTRQQIKRALGGVLFIDEAYSLARGGDKDFGKEAIDTMVKNMEENKDNLVLILAGYKQEMVRFLETNPGLRSRFPIHIDFPDYSTQELLDIADIMLTKRQYQFTPEAKERLQDHLEETMYNRHEHCGNARFVRNVVEKAIRRQALRLVEAAGVSRDELMTVHEEDLAEAIREYT